MGDWDWGREHGLWGDDGIPYSVSTSTRKKQYKIINRKTVGERAPTHKKEDDRSKENSLLCALKTYRRELSSFHGVPAYCIFSDKTLEEMSNKKPTTKNEFQKLNGVGSVKLERFGYEFIKIIKNNIGENLNSSNKHIPRHEVVGDFFCQTLSLDLTEYEFGIQRNTVLKYLFAYQTETMNIPENDIFLGESCLSECQINRIYKKFKSLENEGCELNLKPVFIEFNEQIEYYEISLIRMHYLCNEMY